MKRILLIATGGTIASSSSNNGLRPSFDAGDLLKYIPDIDQICQIEGVSIMSIDSTNMNPNLMGKIAETIFEKYHAYDGFVVTHGTDTMGYTSAGLTYMLRNLKKPVVVTGSQLTIEHLNTDAKKNIRDAIRLATEDIAGVFIVFNGRGINGCRASKIRTKSEDAFGSFNFPFVMHIENDQVIYTNEMYHKKYQELMKIDAISPLRLSTNLCEDIYIVKIYPGIKPGIFDFIKENYKGVIIESYGIGGIPNENYDIVSKIEMLINEGIAVVITTQCLEEGIDLDVYEVGKKLAKHQVIYAGDMNVEAIVMKLMWALGNIDGTDEIKEFMEMPVFGDITR